MKSPTARRNHYDPVYSAWRCMRQRCRNPRHKSFKDYGGRGITIDPAWDAFEIFRDDMGPRPDGMWLEREDNNLGYNKKNCRWVPPAIQARNKRSNTLLTIGGETKCLIDWCRHFGASARSVRRRIKQGVDPVLAVQIRTSKGVKHAIFAGLRKKLSGGG